MSNAGIRKTGLKQSLRFAPKSPQNLQLWFSLETGAESCDLCPVGYFCDVHNGTVLPEICPKGTYCASNGTIVPTPCPPGTHNPVSEPGNEPKSSEFCVGCPAGYFCGSIGIGELSDDRKCQAGFICRGNSTAKDPIGSRPGMQM